MKAEIELCQAMLNDLVHDIQSIPGGLVDAKALASKLLRAQSTAHEISEHLEAIKTSDLVITRTDILDRMMLTGKLSRKDLDKSLSISIEIPVEKCVLKEPLEMSVAGKTNK